ncbi:SDR family NAD(P)-dependent oxidoreductase [Kaistia terrae]|uniref:SDR family NAD(P)-dependent oxidoreductase n=1 Tax=Kaistia terrae TaxID=537017 RepID=A0ABW0PPP2_9HYPH|nr:SDR family NAD(P)-dependent oxidoreductase [Kaistia terrae]MCX5577694.1 SDR family NAD(P)-dependent oxidoreductase [Kaistia terrae]
MDERGLAGKVALITGAGRPGGLGQGMARKLASQGAKIVLHDRGALSGPAAPAHGVGTATDLEAVAAELRADGAEVATVTGDLLDEAAIARVVGAAVENFDRLDILINNAGVGYLFGPLVELEAESWDVVLGVNLRAPALATKHAARQMIAQGQGGRIINIASQAAKSGFAFASAYTASKHGLIGLTRSAALELGEHGITVNAICPNHVTTGLGAWQNRFMSEARGQSIDAYLDEMRARIPLRRTGTPNDTAETAAFLCSDAAAYITAEAINVSGGEEYH